MPQIQMDTLRNYENFKASLRCHDWVPPTVSGGSDIDWFTERHGKLLFIESKRREGPKLHVPAGQFVALRALASKPDINVWLVAEDEEAKFDEEIPRYSRLILDANSKPHAQGIRNNQKQALFYTDNRLDSLTLKQLQDEVYRWWAAQ